MDKAFNIIDLFYLAAGNNPGKIAIIDKNRQISFSALETEIRSTSIYFKQKGIQKRDRVLVFVPMSIDLYRIVLALFHIGATAVFLDEWVSKERMEQSCKVAQCQAFIGVFKARVFAHFSKELRKIPIKLGVGYSTNKNAGVVSVEADSWGTALITFTTGSTGIPKAAKRTHKILYNQFTALRELISPTEDDVDLCALPIVLLINLAAGCTSVIADYNPRKPELMDAGKIYRQIKRYAVNRFVASPFFVKKLSVYLIHHHLSLPGLHKVFTGGAPVFPSDAVLFQKAFPHQQVQIVYGSTEAEPISSIHTNDLAKEIQNTTQQGINTGIPHQQTKVKIIQLINEDISCTTEEELNAISLPAGSIGEIIVSGHHVVREYLHNEDAIRKNKIFVADECWHRTGDSGYLTTTGQLYFTGRCNTLINRNGILIAPLVYENFFQAIGGVEIGTVMELNQQLTAVIEMNQSSLKENIEQQLKKCNYKFDDIKFIKKMPRDLRHHSKIDYEKLKQVLM